MENYYSYECGFDPYGQMNYSYDISFYVMALLFLMFDMEMVYLYPMIYQLNIYTYFYSLMFMLMLMLGLIYEYKNSNM